MPGAGQDIWRPCLPWPMGFFALVGGLGERVLLLTHSSGQPVESVFAGLYESLCFDLRSGSGHGGEVRGLGTRCANHASFCHPCEL